MATKEPKEIAGRLISSLEVRERRAWRNQLIATLPVPAEAMPANKALHGNPQEVEKCRIALGLENAAAIAKYMEGFKPSSEAANATAAMPVVETVKAKG